MTVKTFLEKLGKIEVKIESISAIYRNFVYDFKVDVLNYDEQIVYDYLQKFSAEGLASFGVKLGRCLSECKEEQKNLIDVVDTPYAENIKKIEILMERLVAIYYEVSKKTSAQQDSTATTVKQHDEYLEEVKGKLKELNESVDSANKLIDDKIFTLLINTVAILGIFVAIAFAGFGVTSIFSNINFTQACMSYDKLVKAVFFLITTALLSYNLLLLLVYFIFKLSRPLIIRAQKDKDGKEFYETFSKTINLTPFLWIDGILFLLSIGFFIWCLFL